MDTGLIRVATGINNIFFDLDGSGFVVTLGLSFLAFEFGDMD